jgi:hypothetical protein|tara:strand:- start:768 stop:1763 length:996 start_codon:yes stop_codon:yes gene_type:complete
MKCLACNFNLENGNKFCGSCGTKVEPINSCSECNTINDIGNKFCGSCGNNLNKNLKIITTVKIGTEKNSDIIQSLYNKDIPETNSSLFSFKKWFDEKYLIPPQDFEKLYNNDEIDLYQSSQIRKFWNNGNKEKKQEIMSKLISFKKNLELKNSSNRKQFLDNNDITEKDDVPFFNIKKLFNSIIGIVIYLIFCFFIIPIISVGLNFAIYGKMVGPISAVGGLTIINLTIFGFANRNIASNSNRNITNAFWLGFLGPLGLVICLFNSVKLAQKKILLGILRFFIFAIAIQLLGELGIISNGGKGLLLYFFGFTFILRGVNMFNYSVKKKMLF